MSLYLKNVGLLESRCSILENLKRTYSLKYNLHLENAKKHNKNIVLFAILESAVLILVFYIQIKYILNLAKKM